MPTSKYDQNSDRVEISQRKFFKPPSPSSPCLWVALRSLTIHTITQFLTLSNFFHKRLGEFKFDNSKGKIKVDQNFTKNFTTLFPSVSLPMGSPPKIRLFTQWGHCCDLLFYISIDYLHRAASGEYIENQIVVYPIEIIVLFLWFIP